MIKSMNTYLLIAKNLPYNKVKDIFFFSTYQPANIYILVLSELKPTGIFVRLKKMPTIQD